VRTTVFGCRFSSRTIICQDRLGTDTANADKTRHIWRSHSLEQLMYDWKVTLAHAMIFKLESWVPQQKHFFFCATLYWKTEYLPRQARD
jgi:hypothetical protein